jgi:5-methylcytosine-specific restriction endonuclease McrA
MAELPYEWTDEDWWAALEAFGNRCAYCCADTTLTIDHVIALADPTCPGTVPGNIAPACGPCNYSKQDMPLAEWRPGVAEHVFALCAALAVA